MLNLDIYHTNQCLSLELPLPTEVLAGELHAFHVEQTMDHITQDNFTLTPTNELGKHFMKLVKPDDSLHRIVISCRELDVLAGDSRQGLVDLIMADRFRDLDHMHDYLQYGPDTLSGLMRLTRDGRSLLLPTKEINMYHCFGPQTPMGLTRLAEMDLAPVSEMGRRLIAEFQPYSDTAAIANLACDLVKHPAFAQADLGKFMEGIRVFQMPMDTETLNFYCPLFVRQYDPDIEEYEPIDHVYLARNEDEIRAALHAWTDGKDETEFLDDNLRPKIASLGWEIERFSGEVYGKAVCEIRAPLTESEQAELAQWLSEHASDGLLDNFWEYPIKTGDGDLYVSFWDYNSVGYMLPEGDFQMRLLEQQSAQHDAAPATAEPQKPDCPLIGQDGNVFGLIGLAARTLREHGLADQAKEMSERAFGSGSYDEALGIITEYVNVTSVYDDMDDDEDEDWCREPEYDEDEFYDEPDFGGMGDMA